MNKAFVKEDHSSPPQDPEPRPDAHSDIPRGAKNYMTPGGMEKLRMELHRLSNEQRPQLIARINRSRTHDADRVTSDEFNEAKRELRKTDLRIDFLSRRLELAEIVDPLKVRSEHVQFGATVQVLNEDGLTKTYRIVGIDEADIDLGRIGWTSPLAKALLDAKAGDAVNFKSPGGEEELEVLSVDYLEIR
jgi:transcription elongation factor GreB